MTGYHFRQNSDTRPHISKKSYLNQSQNTAKLIIFTLKNSLRYAAVEKIIVNLVKDFSCLTDMPFIGLDYPQNIRAKATEKTVLELTQFFKKLLGVALQSNPRPDGSEGPPADKLSTTSYGYRAFLSACNSRSNLTSGFAATSR